MSQVGGIGVLNYCTAEQVDGFRGQEGEYRRLQVVIRNVNCFWESKSGNEIPKVIHKTKDVYGLY